MTEHVGCDLFDIIGQDKIKAVDGGKGLGATQ